MIVSPELFFLVLVLVFFFLALVFEVAGIVEEEGLEVGTVRALVLAGVGPVEVIGIGSEADTPEDPGALGIARAGVRLL